MFVFFVSENVGQFPLENPLQKSATCVSLPINLFGDADVDACV